MYFALFMLAFNVLALVVVCSTPLSLPLKVVLSFALLLTFFYYLLRDVLLLLPDSWSDVFLDQDNVSVTEQQGTKLTGKISGKTVVSPHFVALCVVLNGLRLPVCRVFFSDAMDAGVFRKFRVHLKFG